MPDTAVPLIGASAMVHVPRGKLREKMELAMVNLARRYPATAKAFARQCENERKKLSRKSGMWTGDKGEKVTDTYHHYLRPPMVFEWLELSEIASNLAPDCQCPCGIGRKRWWYDRDLLEEFLNVAPICRLSDMRGIPKREV